MLTCSCDVLLLAGSSLYSAAGCTAVYITGFGRSLEKAWDIKSGRRWAAVKQLDALHVGHEQLLLQWGAGSMALMLWLDW
jgi:hypothetical protein